MQKHHGVGVIITNRPKELFYLQQKDRTYPFKEYRLKYSLFGGAIEAGESEQSALERELMEELAPEAARILLDSSRKAFEIEIPNKQNSYNFTLFEAAMPTPQIEEVSAMPVKEGRGCLVSLGELKGLEFIHSLGIAVHKYLQTMSSKEKK